MSNLFKFTVLSGFFFPPQHYPDYYAIIKEPIDLRTIAQRIQVQLQFLVFAMCVQIFLKFQKADSFYFNQHLYFSFIDWIL